jgi:tetratricopeptide (TPR) repeat protein
MVYGDVSELESRFEAQAFDLAKNMGNGADWQVLEEDEWPELDAENQVWDAWLNQRPKHYETLRRSAIRAIKQGDWDQAKSHALEMIELFPKETGPQCGRALLSQVHQGLNDVESEIKTLQDWAQIDAEAIAAYERLMALGLQTNQPELTLNAAQKFLAVDPFRDAPYAMSALAYEMLDKKNLAADQLIKRLELDPTNPSRIEFQIASHLVESDTQRAKQYVLRSLEDAPRFRDGLKLLLEINRKENPTTENDPTETSDQGSNPNSDSGPEKSGEAVQSGIPEVSSDGI